ncbi:asparaginase domain-containing protein, partial [Leucobacter soli]
MREAPAHAIPTVLVFATGGTIGMRRTEKGLAPDPRFPDALEEMVAEICGPIGAQSRINHLNPPIDSANADVDTAPRIARTVGARARTARPRGIVITHGTDTLAFTAARLAFELAELGVPVVLTGSQLPYGAEGSDAGPNLALAIRT